jgi:SAM-dependent methyltransferase
MKTLRKVLERIFFRSATYWEKRYRKGGTSGDGSYDELARFKGDFINTFVREHQIRRLFDFGCGDGNQAGYLEVEEFMGVDVSPTAVALCRKKFEGRAGRKFLLYDAATFRGEVAAFGPELAISMDVVYHLVEDEVFVRYMRELFESAGRYVIIYSSNFDKRYESPHQVDRKFTDYVGANIPEYGLEQTVTNPFRGRSNSDFFVYARKRPPER